jgi:hypothetical protein
MRRRLAVVPAAVLGMLGAHSLAYRLVAPDGAHRHELLEMTGHSWSALVPLIVGTTFLAVIAGSWQRAAGRGRPVRFVEILLAQTSLYVLVESAERAAHGVSAWPGMELVLAGAAVQLPVALFVWAALRFVVDPAVAAVRAALNGLPQRRPAASGFVPVDSSFFSLPARCDAGRGPPLSV